MSSLQEHLARHDLAISPLAFRRDCPVCRAERVHGQLPSATLVPARACAAMTAAVLATSAVAPGTVAAADRQGVAAPAPASPPPPQVSDHGIGGGGAAPVDRDQGDANGPRDVSDSRPSDDLSPSQGAANPETDAGTSPSDAPLPARSGQAGQSGGGRADQPAGDGPKSPDDDAPTIQPGPAQAPTDDGGPPAGAENTPNPAGQTPGPAPAPSPARSERPPAPAPSHGQSRAGHATSTENPGTPPAADPTLAHRLAGAGGVHGGSAPRGSAPSTDRAGRGERGGARDADQGDGRRDRVGRTAHHAGERVADADGPGTTTLAARRVEAAQPATYRVRPGDSLWRIAGRHLGSHATATAIAQEVTRLWELNRQRIGTGNPDLIFPGQTLRM